MPIVLFFFFFSFSAPSLIAPAFARPNQISKYTYDQLTACHFAEDTCRACWTECPSARYSFFASLRDTYAHEHLVLSLQECLRETKYYRQWLPHWCINDRNSFYRTQQFPITQRNCLMQPYPCSQHIEKKARDQLKQKKVAPNNNRFILSVKIGQLGRVQHNLTTELEQFEERKKKIEKITKAWNERWLEEAELHIKNPEENVTKYADPVFQNYQSLLEENRQLDFQISRNDLVSATVENKFVRRDTVDKIPNYLHSIQQLKNRIHSKKSETDRYLEEIKQIAARTAVLQEEATNIIYETTHAKQLDGEIVVLDKQLLDLYIQLKKERTKLRKLNVRATFIKLRLVAIMRMTIQQITRQQVRKGCPAPQVMGF